MNIWGLEQKLKRAGKMVKKAKSKGEAEHIKDGMQNIRSKIKRLKEERNRKKGK